MTADATREALRELRRAYKRCFKSPDDELRWKACALACREVITALESQEMARMIDPIIARAIQNGHGTPAQAGPNLREAGRDVVDLERRLGSELGYRDREFRGLLKIATKTLDTALREGRTLDAPQTAQALAEHLRHVDQQVRAAYQQSIMDSRRTKNAHRHEAREHLYRHLYAVGAIVANAAKQELFAYSYALSIGVHAASLRRRRGIKIPTRERLAA